MHTRLSLRALVCASTILLVTVGPTQAAVMYFRNTVGAASGPPYPSSAVEHELYDSLLLPAVQKSRLTTQLEQVICDGSVRPATLQGSDDGSRTAPGLHGGLKFFCDGSVSQLLTGSLLLTSFGDGSVRQLSRLDAFTHDANTFDFSFNFLAGDGSVRKHSLHGALVAGQPFEIGGIEEQLAGDGSVRLLFGLNKLPGDFTPGSELITMSWSAELVPEPTSVLLIGAGAVCLLRKRSIPLAR